MLDSRQRADVGPFCRRHQQSRRHDLQSQTRSGGALEFPEGTADDVSSPAGFRRAEEFRLRHDLLGLVVSSIDKSPLQRVGNTLHDDHIPHALEQVRDETTGLVSAINHPFDNVEQCCTVAIHERLNGRIENDALRHTQLARDLGVRHPAGSRSRNHLTEDRQRVPHASGSRASHQ